MSLVNTTITAVVAALQAAPALPNVARVRLRPVSAASSTAIVVRPAEASVSEASMTSGQVVSWDLIIGVECYARATAAQAPDVAVDATVEAVYARLMADPTLAGAVLQLQPRAVSYDFDADGENTVCATLLFSARLRAPLNTF